MYGIYDETIRMFISKGEGARGMAVACRPEQAAETASWSEEEKAAKVCAKLSALAELAGHELKVKEIVVPVAVKAESAPLSEVFPEKLTEKMLETFVTTREGWTRPKVGVINGVKYIAKFSGRTNKAHILNEVVADEFQRACGLSVPPSRAYEVTIGGRRQTVRLSVYVENAVALKDAKKFFPEYEEAIRAQIELAYPIETLIANTDAFHNDNVLVDQSAQVWFVDNGSGFGFRATGGRKTVADGFSYDYDKRNDAHLPPEQGGWLSLYKFSSQLQAIMPEFSEADFADNLCDYDFVKICELLKAEQKSEAFVKYAKSLDDWKTECFGDDEADSEPETKEVSAQDMQQAVAENLKGHDWHYTLRDFGDGECAVDTDITSRSGIFKFYEIRFLFTKWDMQSIYYLPIKAPEAMRLAVAEYLTRINWRTKYGKFEMDFDDGEIRYTLVTLKCAVMSDLEDVLGDSFDMMRSTLDRYANGFMSVVAGAKTAKDAFEEAVKPKDKKPPEPPAEPPPEPPATPSADGDVLAGGASDAEIEAAIEHDLELFEESAGDESATKAPKTKKPAKRKSRNCAAKRYTLKGLNIQGKIPLEKVVAAVKKFREAKRADVDAPRLNILLSGAPGSGKTAFARYLARAVGAPIKTIRASDLLSKWVGETEKRLAEVFEEAKEKGQILFLDEIDSFLQDRAGADHGWEITQVNQLLQEMENFEGVLIGATNFSERLDKAVLRRFTYKLKLDYLTDEGKGIFFEKYFETPLTPEEVKRLNAIGNLTPGDFRTVREELFYLSDNQTNAERLDALEAESEAKGKERAKIGF